MVFNRSIKNDINMRVFEALASGSLLLTNDLGENGQGELFRDGAHLAAYREADDLLDKIEFYLRREKLRERIAAAGRAEVVEKHTFGHRMEQVLRAVQAALARIAVAVTAVRANPQSPGWGGIVQPGVLTPGPATPATASVLSPERGGIVEPGVLTPGMQSASSPPFSSSPRRATPANAEARTMSPRWGSVEGREGDRTAKPAAHAAGYMMSPRRGSESRGGCDTPHPAANAAGYVMSPRWGSPDAPDRCMTPATGRNTQEPSYFAHVRPEILALVPETARAVLDIGCGAGRLGEAIKARQQAEVVGIELNESAAAAARRGSTRCASATSSRSTWRCRRAGSTRSSAAIFSSTSANPSGCSVRAREWLAPDGAARRQHSQRAASQRGAIGSRGELDL